MTNYNERLDEILHGITGSKNLRPQRGVLAKSRDEAKAAITSLIKELVAKAKPGYDAVRESGRDEGIDEFEQNLLKALEDK